MGGGNGAEEMQLEEAEGGEYRSEPGIYFLGKASQGMTNPKAVGWINILIPTQHIDDNFLLKIYFSNEVSYKNTNCYWRTCI